MKDEQQVLNQLQETFETQFQLSGEAFYFSPGRVNLIGEHIDYNGGYVFPCAITMGTYGLVKLREDRTIRCYSMNLSDEGVIEFSLDDLSYQASHNWVNYVKGVITYFNEITDQSVDRGFDLVVWGNIPNGAGLSSSASLELLIGVMLNDLFNQTVDRLDLVRIGQRVENDYLGLQTGIMDQFAIGMGEAEAALYLNVNTLDYERVPAEFGDYVILIMNTNKRRELTSSKYNQRRQECEQALQELQQAVPIENLCDLSWDEWSNYSSLIKDPVIRSRARHAISENERTQQAKMALTQRDLATFGQLLNHSHQSLRDDYDVTGPELDAMVEAAWAQPAVLGARMTGAGMGGCAIALVDHHYLAETIEQIESAYYQATGLHGDYYTAQVGDGTKKVCQNNERGS